MTIKQRLSEVLSNSGAPTVLSESDFSKPFAELGLDSLDVYSFFTEIEIDLRQFTSIRSQKHESSKIKTRLRHAPRPLEATLYGHRFIFT